MAAWILVHVCYSWTTLSVSQKCCLEGTCSPTVTHTHTNTCTCSLAQIRCTHTLHLSTLTLPGQMLWRDTLSDRRFSFTLFLGLIFSFNLFLCHFLFPFSAPHTHTRTHILFCSSLESGWVIAQGLREKEGWKEKRKKECTGARIYKKRSRS